MASDIKNIPIPKDKQLTKISSLLEKKFNQQERKNRYALAKEVLTLLGKGLLLSTVFIAPGITRAMKPLLQLQKDKDYQTWKKFNTAYLRRTIKRLERQKLVEVKQAGKKQLIQITKKGKRKILQYAIDELELEKKWDGMWRIVLYDIPVKKHRLQMLIRESLKRLKFYQLQKSVYLIPFPCEGEIEFLKEYYGLRENIKIIKFKDLEGEEIYREYFGI